MTRRGIPYRSGARLSATWEDISNATVGSECLSAPARNAVSRCGSDTTWWASTETIQPGGLVAVDDWTPEQLAERGVIGFTRVEPDDGKQYKRLGITQKRKEK
jgi:hypothetical protein